MGQWGPPICASATVATIGELVIEGESGDPISLHIDGCWNFLDPTMLWAPFGARGENVVIPSTPGRFPEPWRLDQSTYDLQIVIDGDNDWNGDPYSNPWEGLETNLEYLVDELIIPPADVTVKTRPATLAMPSGAMRGADVQPRSQQHRTSELQVIYMTMALVVCAGRFEVVPS